MTRKLVLGAISAGLAMAMIAPAMADRGGAPRDQGYSSGPSRGAPDDRGYDRGRDSHDRYDRHDRYDDRRVRTQSFPTRYRANILLTESVSWNGRRPANLCTVEVRGPEARRVTRKEVSRVARNHCSRYARIIYR